MSTQATDAAGEDVEIEARPRESGLSGKRLVLFILLPLLLLIGGGVTLQVTGLADDLLRGGAESSEKAPVGPSVFYDLPELLVNLNSGGKRPNYLKLRVSLELTDAQSVHHIERVLPRIVDSFQVYLRELRIDDLRGSAGLYRLREELLLRVNAAAEPVVIRDVLFKEMLVQ